MGRSQGQKENWREGEKLAEKSFQDVSELLTTLEAKVAARRHLEVGLAGGIQVGQVAAAAGPGISG